jgi:hypothetical protein
LVVECWPSFCKTLGLISSTERKNNGKNEEIGSNPDVHSQRKVTQIMRHPLWVLGSVRKRWNVTENQFSWSRGSRDTVAH